VSKGREKKKLLLNIKIFVSGDHFYYNQSNSLYASAEKVYGQKILKMNESVFSGLFRHAEKVRIQNHVQEKMLHEKVNGHKGIEKKLQYASFVIL
jgi:hypothetical protein